MKFYEAKLVKIVKENSDSYSYIMNIPQGYAWKAGQHAMFRLKGYIEQDQAHRYPRQGGHDRGHDGAVEQGGGHGGERQIGRASCRERV